MVHKILCPVDFTEDSINAANYSNELALLCKAELVLIHVKNLMAVSQGRLPMEGTNLVVDLENNAKAEMSSLVASLSERNKGIIKAIFKVGINTGEALIQAMNEHDPDLMVMYTAGITGLGDRITGTKTDRIIDKTSVPLLLVPGTFKYAPIKSFLFATDNKGDDQKNLKYVTDLAGIFNAHTYVLHVVKDSKGNFEPNNSLKLESSTSISYEKVVNADINEGITEFAEKNGCGIKVMSTYTRSFFEKIFSTSFTKNMAYDLKRPLLVLDKD